MKFRYKDYFKAEPSTGYETLIYDCMIGDNILFQRADGVEAGWRGVEPFLDGWKKDRAAGLKSYQEARDRPRRMNFGSAPPAAGEYLGSAMAGTGAHPVKDRTVIAVADAAALA